MASVDINIVGATPPFNFSVKDEFQVERFLSYNNGKIYFSDIQDSNNHTYTVTVSKGSCVINNEVILYNCGSSTPTPVLPAACIAPVISLVAVNNTTVTISVNTASSNCSGYQFQYSNFIDFTTFNSINTSCNTQQYIDVPTLGIWYFRILKTCDNQSTVYSNIITAQVLQSSPTPTTTCTSCKYYNIYSAFSSWQINYLDCNNVPSTAYGIAGGNTTICACEDSISTVTGNVVITDLGVCSIPVPVNTNCTSYDLTAGTSGTTWRYTPCNSDEVITTVLSTGQSLTNICVKDSYGMVKVSGNGIKSNNGGCDGGNNSCVGLRFIVTLEDLQSSDGSIVFAQYTDCFGITHSENFTNPGTYTGYCAISTSVTSIYRYVMGVESTGTSYFNTLTQC